MKLDPCVCHSWYVLHVTGYASVGHGITYKVMKVLILFCHSWTARSTANMLQRECLYMSFVAFVFGWTSKSSSFIPNCASQ